jgi:hypothetical protein
MKPVKAVIEIPEALDDLFGQCETVCVSACCGRDAFDIDPELIRQWAKEGKAEKLRLCIGLLESVSAEFSEMTAEYRVKGFDEQTTGAVWKEWFREWKVKSEEVLKEVSE